MNKAELDLFHSLLDKHLATQTDIMSKLDARMEKVEDRMLAMEGTLSRGKGAVGAFLTFLSLFGIFVGAITRYFSGGPHGN